MFPFTVLILYVVPPTTNFCPTGFRTSASSAFILPLHADLTNHSLCVPDREVPDKEGHTVREEQKESDMWSGAGLESGGAVSSLLPRSGVWCSERSAPDYVSPSRQLPVTVNPTWAGSPDRSDAVRG